MKTKIIITIFCFVTSLSAQATLVSRLGGQAYYDTALDVTWLTDGNVAATNRFTGTLGSAVTGTGTMNWATAGTWVGLMNSLNSGAGHLGVNTWRLPTVSPVNGVALDNSSDLTADGSIDVGYNISATGSAFPGSTAHELAHLFYNTLGNIGRLDVNSVLTGCASTAATDTCFTNTGPFQFENITNSTVRAGYWQNEFDAGLAFDFVPYTGQQSTFGKAGFARVWLVSSGDVAVVPIPAAVWLFASGLVVLISNRKKSL